MNKYLMSVLFASQTIFCTQSTTPVNLFAKLTPSINKKADVWANKVVTTLKPDLQLALLNLFAFSSEEIIKQCLKYIQEDKDADGLLQEWSVSTIEIFNTYGQDIENKIAQKKNMTKKEEEAIWQKFQFKLQELAAHIHEVYYQTLYNTMAKKMSPAQLTHMFNETGLIAKENRVKALPQPL